MNSPLLGFVFDRTWPASAVVDVARRLDRVDGARLWFVEDCFHTSAVPLAAAALAVTDRLRVGLGILPAVVRNPAVAAMEIATLDGLAPGRVMAGIGHGVPSWMAQIGAVPDAPLVVLEEVLQAVRQLLAGEVVRMSGTHVRLDAVQLDTPPVRHVPVLAGVRGPRSLALAGREADGVLLADPASPSYLRWARAQAGDPAGAVWATYSPLCLMSDGAQARRIMAPWLAGLLTNPTPGISALPFAEELVARWASGGLEALVEMPRQWWVEIAPVGDTDDVLAHVHAVGEAGAEEVGLAPSPDLSIGIAQLDDVVMLAAALSG